MGLFSFLDRRQAETPESAVEPKPVAEPLTTAAPTPAPATPFTPPEAWDTAALTAPRPEASGDTPNVGPPDPRAHRRAAADRSSR